MAQNTALMEAINKFDNLNPYHVFTAQEVVDMLTELLPKERKDIEDAVNYCWRVNEEMGFIPEGSDYFTNTFNHQ